MDEPTNERRDEPSYAHTDSDAGHRAALLVRESWWMLLALLAMLLLLRAV